MGIGTKNGFERAVLAADNGGVYSLRKRASIKPVSVSVSDIRFLYYDQAGGCNVAFRACYCWITGRLGGEFAKAEKTKKQETNPSSANIGNTFQKRRWDG